MGTRSTIRIMENGKFLVNIYQQYDGYPDGVGNDLKEFIKSGKLVNGINPDKGDKLFNGAGCLAAQFIAEFKHGAGGLYIVESDVYQEFNYMVNMISEGMKWTKIEITCEEEPDFKEVIDVTN